MVIMPDTRIRMAPGQSSSVLGKETIVLNYKLGNYYELNEIGGFIWALLQDNSALSVGELQERILSEFDVEQSVCQQELALFLENLLREKLIELTV